MPELPDLEAYLAALRPRVLGVELLRVTLVNPFLLRTFEPPLESAIGRSVTGLERLGKRIVIGLGGDSELFLVIHLMIAGRLHWKEPDAAVPRGRGLAAFYFPGGTLLLTEAGKKRRASLHVAVGRDGLSALDPGGIEVMSAPAVQFRAALGRENHTLKRALTDPRIVSGIGNAYSDEILHRAGLSPFKQTDGLTDEEFTLLREATLTVLSEWTQFLIREMGEDFPEKVTAFRPEMAVHGRYRLPCPVCGTPVQRIVYADSESNYCPRCQTGGRVLADRALSRLLKDSRPKTIDELETKRGARES